MVKVERISEQEVLERAKSLAGMTLSFGLVASAEPLMETDEELTAALYQAAADHLRDTGRASITA